MIPTDDFLPVELATLVDAELGKGERIVWIGQPIPSRLARSTLPIVLFGIPVTAFAFFWIVTASGIRGLGFPGPSCFFVLFGIPFVLVGLGMLTSPVWMYLKAGRTVYAVTDRRALVIDGGLFGGMTVRSFEPASMTGLTRTQFADGSGNLIFQREYRPGGRHGRFIAIGFFAIPDVKAVEDHIRELVRKAGIPDGGQI